MGSGRTLRTRHGDDLTLEVALEDAPRALINRKGGLTSKACVLVCLNNDPSGRVRDPLQEHECE